jgi:hypothetical protein
MKRTKILLSVLVACLTILFVVSCKDDFTEEDLIKQQNEAKLKELSALSAKDSLDFVSKLNALEYEQYLDSVKRVDSLALANGAYLPYTYQVQVYNGSASNVSNGRTQDFASDVTVTIIQYGVKQTQTSRDGLFTFANIGVGTIHGTITGAGFTTFEWTIDVSLPYNFFKEVINTSSGNPFANGYYLEALLRYFNQRSLGNSFPIFATTGANTATFFGRAFIETNLTNRTKEVVPAGTNVTASINVDDAGFRSRYVIPTAADPIPSTNPGLETVNNIFRPKKWALTFVGQSATNATGDFSVTTPASPDGLPIRFEYDDVVANKTYFLQTNGDVTSVTRRNAYGQAISGSYSNVPNITLAPTVTFFAGGGAVANATISGDGAVTDIDLTFGGQNYQGTPRVIIGPPPAGGTQATATTVVTNGVVTDITVTNGGSGYVTAPTVTITEGTGATALPGGFQYNSASGGVDNVQITNPGNVNVAPTVVFYADFDNDNVYDVGEEMTATNFPNGIDQSGKVSIGTNFPTGTANLNGSGVGVASVSITNAGGGLNFAPDVLITSGILGNISVTIAGGVVTTVTINNGGRFYSTPPVINLNAVAAAGTTNAVLTATLTSGAISAVAITNAGAGYVDGVYVLNHGNNAIVPNGGNSQAAGDVVWRGLNLASIDVTNPGTIQTDNKYYTTPPKVVISQPDFNGTGAIVATATAILGTDGRVIGINVTNPGSGYYNLPTINLVSGTGAAGTSKLGNRFVSEITVSNGGSGYITAPAVLVVDPASNGTGAIAVAKLTNGVVTTIEITNGGTGYGSNPTVIILDPGTSYNPNTFARYNNAAMANVIVEDGEITEIEIYQSGDNYPTGTELRINANGKGSGATATATVAGGRVTGTAVTAGGLGYVGNNYARALNADVNPDVASNLPSILNFNAPATQTAKSGVKKLMDIDYGTGQNKD